jgi:hypothetical protein
MDYILGIVKNHKFINLHKLTMSEIEQYEKSFNYIEEFKQFFRPFEMLRVNYSNYIKVSKKYLKKYKIVLPIITFSQFDDMVINIATYLTNYLSTIHIFLNHSEGYLNKIYSKSSQKYISFDNARKSFHHNNFSYKFIYELRNYSQHYSIPFHELHFERKKIGHKRGRCTIAVLIDKDELLNGGYKKWKKLESEIKKLPNNFDINKHIIIMEKCLERLFYITIKDDLAQLLKSAQFMLYLLDYTKGETGKTCILKEKDSSKNYVFFSSSLVKEIINVSKESIQEYKEIIK